MKHYLWYKTNGEFGGAMSQGTGWPVGADPTEATPTDPIAAHVKSVTEAYTDYSGMLEYSCPCTAPPDFCQDADDRCHDSYVDAGALTAKPTCTLDLAGVTITPNDYATPEDRTPAASLAFKVVGASVPDGHTVDVVSAGGVDLLQSFPQTLTFTGGETNTVNLTVPAQGGVGGICVRSKYVPTKTMFLRGWA